MLRTIFLAASVIGLVWTASAQQVDPFVYETQAKPKRAGTYHVVSGTWLRDLPAGVNLGPDIVYNNSAELNHWTSGGIENETVSFDFVDAGRIPGTTSTTLNANRDNLTINCIEIGYCILEDFLATGPLDVEVSLYQNYTPCSDPSDFPLAGRFIGEGLPGWIPGIIPGVPTCWTVNFDLSGGAEICLLSDGDAVFNSDLDFDSFGIGFEYDPHGLGGYVGAVGVGPMLAGDRKWTAQAPGELLAGTPGGGGGGTYYGPTETCVPTLGGPNSSGFDSEDLWWTGSRPTLATPAGCFWFNGYENDIGCNADGQIGSTLTQSQAAGHVILLADGSDDCVPVDQRPIDPTTSFCDPASNNSTGGPVTLAGFTIATGSGLHLDANGGPANQFGYFLIGVAMNATSPIMVSNGFLCLSIAGPNQVGRYNVGGGSLNSTGQFNANGEFVNTMGTSSSLGNFGFDVPSNIPIPGIGSILQGQTWHFQLWYRDTSIGPGNSNMSNGVSMVF